MTDNRCSYTGQLKYKDIDFTFVFNGEELMLIPPKEKREDIRMNWLLKPLGNGMYISGDPLYIEDAHLIGRCNETANRIVFITKQGSRIKNNNEVLFIDISAYIICECNEDLIDRMSISSPEINCIHPINQAFSYSADSEKFFSDGTITVTTKDFDATTTSVQEFNVDEKTVRVFFGIERSISTKIGNPPLALNSYIIFEFEPTNDYTFLFRLWRIAKNFIQFLCYRRNISISISKLHCPFGENKHRFFGSLHTLETPSITELYTLEKGRYIKQQYIAGSEGKIFSDLVTDMIYMRHLPETYYSASHKDAARFVMITAAFEWEFRRLYPAGISKSEASIKAEETAKNEICKLLEVCSGKLKKIYKRLAKSIEEDSLQSKIIHIKKDYDHIVGVFGKSLYELNGEKLDYNKMGERLSIQRNNFAHGNLDKDFIGLSLLDLVFLEFILYAMQLKYYGVEDKNIQRAINDLFDRGEVL